MKRWLTGILIFCLLIALVGCKKAPTGAGANQVPGKIQLTYYRLFDGEDVFEPLIRQYESEHRNVDVVYKKFTNPEKYLDLIINELAEGQGPDLFSMHNTWFTQHRRKLNPAPTDLISEQDFEATFVNVAAQDLILPNDDGQKRIYGLPLYVDTLGLYYNKDHFEDALPSRGKPATTWKQLQEDVFKLTKADNSFERFEVAGVAMGRSDNILRAVDLLYLLMIQSGTSFYDPTFNQAIFSDSQGASATGLSQPGIDALDFYTSFALPSNKYYSWNASLASAASSEKEVKTFARGKVSMIFGYSYLYDEILNEIKELEKSGTKAISANSIDVAPVPQMEDPETSTEKRDAYADYFAETVSRTSKHPDEAWKFLSFLVSKESLQHYYDETHRPTSRRDLIESQLEDPVYGVFTSQTGYAESFPMADAFDYRDIFSAAIEAVLSTTDPKDALKAAQEKVNLLIPEDGLFTLIDNATP